MTNITIINPRTAWKSDSGIFYTICLIFILYKKVDRVITTQPTLTTNIISVNLYDKT